MLKHQKIQKCKHDIKRKLSDLIDTELIRSEFPDLKLIRCKKSDILILNNNFKTTDDKGYFYFYLGRTNKNQYSTCLYSPSNPKNGSVSDYEYNISNFYFKNIGIKSNNTLHIHSYYSSYNEDENFNYEINLPKDNLSDDDSFSYELKYNHLVPFSFYKNGFSLIYKINYLLSHNWDITLELAYNDTNFTIQDSELLFEELISLIYDIVKKHL